MNMKTIINLPAMIRQNFDPLLWLDDIERYRWIVDNKIVPKRNKQIRSQDVGRARDFKKLLEEFEEIYERKKIEKAEYDAKIQKAKKRRDLSITSGTCQFKRYKSFE